MTTNATDTVQGTGTIGDFIAGSLAVEDQAYVLTSTRQQLLLGTRTAQPPFDGTFEVDGSITIYDLGPVVAQPTLGYLLLGENGRLRYVESRPFGAFEDFAIFEDDGAQYRAQDPVDGYVEKDTAGELTGGSGQPWTRHSRVFVPPKGTRYVVPRITLGTQPPGTNQYLDSFQMEVLPPGQPDVREYQPPRAVRVTVHPDRRNLSRNPKGAVSTDGWVAATQVSGGLQISGSGGYTLSALVPGEWYTASAYVTASQSVTLNGIEQITERDGYTRRLWITFQAATASDSLTFQGTGNFVVNQVLVERGRTLGDYFDGDSGPDFLWEAGSTPGLGRSYYYPDRSHRHYILTRTLQENVAIGTPILEPIYGSGADLGADGQYGYGEYDYGLGPYGG